MAQMNGLSSAVQTSGLRIAKEKRRIFAGVDFGTSTTKVMWRAVELNAITRLVDFAHGNKNFPSYLMPSSIRLDNENRLWFGTKAEEGDGQVFRSFKVCVACQVGAVDCRGCNKTESGNSVRRGCFQRNAIGFLPAHEFMVYYLAWLLQEVEKSVREAFEEFVEPDLQYNLGVPVAHLNAKPELVDRFEWVLHTALALRDAIHEGIALSEARSRVLEILPQALLPQPNNRRHRALPETSAAALWLQKTLTGVDEANFLLIDVGAGTTDITIYKYDRINPTLPIYGARTIAVASDNIDYATIHWFARQAGVMLENPAYLSSTLLQNVRCRKELVPKPNRPMEAWLGGKLLSLDERTFVDEVVSPQAAKIFEAVNATFRDAYQLARNERYWSAIKIVMLGGGGRITGMKQYFQGKELRRFIQQTLIEPAIPPDLESSHVGDFHLLAVAYGLAFPPVELPEIRPRDKVEPLQQSKPTECPAYDDNPLLSN